MANLNEQKPKYVKVWHSLPGIGYLVPKTPELEAEVEKICKLWKESDALEGYCPYERERKLYEYNTPGYEIGTVAEHTGVVEVVLYKEVSNL